MTDRQQFVCVCGGGYNDENVNEHQFVKKCDFDGGYDLSAREGDLAHDLWAIISHQQLSPEEPIRENASRLWCSAAAVS